MRRFALLSLVGVLGMIFLIAHAPWQRFHPSDRNLPMGIVRGPAWRRPAESNVDVVLDSSEMAIEGIALWGFLALIEMGVRAISRME
jgi:hypothetical protein